MPAYFLNTGSSISIFFFKVRADFDIGQNYGIIFERREGKEFFSEHLKINI